MLIQFSMWTLDDPKLRNEMATIRSILEADGIEFQMNRVSTTVEGEWNEMMNVIQKCHGKLRENHARVLTNISIDDDQ